MNCFLYVLLFSIVLATTQNGVHGDEHDKNLNELKTLFTKKSIRSAKSEFCEEQEQPLKICDRAADEETALKNKFADVNSNANCSYIQLCANDTTIENVDDQCFLDNADSVKKCDKTLKNFKEKNGDEEKCCALEEHRNCLTKIANETFGPQFACAVEEIHKKYSENLVEGCSDCQVESSSSASSPSSITASSASSITASSASSTSPTSRNKNSATTNSTTASSISPTSISGTYTGNVAATPAVSAKKKANTAIPVFANSIVIMVACLGAILY